MKRRQLLKYGSLAASGWGIVACQQANVSLPSLNFNQKPEFSKLEKNNLIIGFVPSISAIPLIIAQEKGLFSHYGLKVQLVKKSNWDEIEESLRKWQFDAAQSLFSLPLKAQLSSDYAPIMALMLFNLNGSGMSFSTKAWKDGIRPQSYFVNFEEFGHSFRKYVRKSSNPLKLATSSPYSLENYLTRYWLASMGIDPQKEIAWPNFPPQQVIYKLQAGIIDGAGISEPWNQQIIEQKAGFMPYSYRDIWKGHPGTILATMSPWVDQHPTTTRALMTSLLEACQTCENPENYPEIAQIVAQPTYLNLEPPLIERLLQGQYLYQNLEVSDHSQLTPDFNIYHYQKTDYLKSPHHANYPWRSHAIWLLTQMVRWQDLGLKTYPNNADELLEKTYPVSWYEEVAKGLNIALPSDPLKIEPSSVFIDHREFDPSTPAAYLKQFELRA